MSDPLDKLRRAAKVLQKSYEAGETDALARIRLYPSPGSRDLKRADFLHVLAREQSFASWPQMKMSVEAMGLDRAQTQQRLKIALYHGQNRVVAALLERHPDVAEGAFGLQCALLDREAVATALAADRSLATETFGPRRPILHLAFSKMVHHWPAREDDMLAIAEMLIAAGADVNDCYPAQPGSPDMLSALYGAIGHANNMVLGQWLLDHGADPNDGESLYHATELGHHDGLRMLIAAGAQPRRTNALKRAMDFDDPVMVRMLLEAGADPNEDQPGPTCLHHAALRRASPEVCRLLLDAGADPSIVRDGITAYASARVFGNTALAAMMEPQDLSREEELLAQAADGIVADGVFIDPARVPRVFTDIVLEFAGDPKKLSHLKLLIQLGMPWDQSNAEGLTPVQIAGWQGQPDMMRYFLSLSPNLGHVNGYGGTLLSTIIHGSENNPERAGRDFIGCLEAALNVGVALPRKAAQFAGVPEIATFLKEWGEQHPGQVVEHGIV